MKKFRLTATINEMVVYKALYTLDSKQYGDILDQYRRDPAGSIAGQTVTIEDLTGKNFNADEDYSQTAPDAVISAIICERFRLFDSFMGFAPLTDEEATIRVETDETDMFDYKCEPVND